MSKSTTPVSGAGQLICRLIVGSRFEDVQQVCNTACICRSPSPAHRPSISAHCQPPSNTLLPWGNCNLHCIVMANISRGKHGRQGSCVTHTRCSLRRRARGASGEADIVRSIGELAAGSEAAAPRRRRPACRSVLGPDRSSPSKSGS